jgi:cell division protein FtsQ
MKLPVLKIPKWIYVKLPVLKIPKWIYVLLGVIPLVVILFYVDSQQGYRRCKGINIEIDGGEPENYFVTEKDVKNLVIDNGHEDLIGLRFDKIDLRKLEKRVKSNNLVKSCQVARGLNGDLNVSVVQHKPIARLVSPSGNNTVADFYISNNGTLLSLSDHYTTRVVLVSGLSFEKLKQFYRKKDQDLVSLLNYIDQSPFWKSQIAQLEIEQDGNILIYPQMGSEIIDFGEANPEEFDTKFKKLKIYYTQILPTKGLNFYKHVSVKFKNQIVCE